VRQLIDESDHAPDRIVVMGQSPSRHTAHFDAMLGDPECRPGVHLMCRQIRRLRVKAGADFRAFEARREMAIDAHGGILSGAFRNHLRIIQV
jgi:hypothetical protein